jgi:hypothetical protein
VLKDDGSPKVRCFPLCALIFVTNALQVSEFLHLQCEIGAAEAEEIGEPLQEYKPKVS